MGRRGPKPMPTKVKAMRGNPGKRPLPKNEPQPASSKTVPKPPEWLPALARTEWRRVAAELHRAKLLTKVDHAALAAYCEAFARWRTALKWTEENGTTIVLRDKDGRVRSVVRAPQTITLENASAQMNRYVAEFGLTPSSRTRFDAPSVEESDPLESFLKFNKGAG